MSTRSFSAWWPLVLPSLLTPPLSALVFPRQPAAQTRPRAQAHPRAAARPRPKTLAYGAKADSLDGIPGHHFGEPRRSFPELVTRGYRDPEGYVSYALRPDQEATGWFGKNTEQVQSTYWFYQDKFAAFTAFTGGPVSQRQVLADEAVYLFGKGQFKGAAFGEATTQWEGKKVLVVYLDGHNEAQLRVNSQVSLAQLAADKLARQQAEAAARAAKFKADNAPPAAH